MKKIKKHERSTAYRIVSGMVVAYAVVFIFLFIMAGLTSKGTLPESVMKYAVLIGCFAGGIAGAVVAVRGYTGRRIAISAGFGGATLLVLCLVGFSFAGKQGFASQLAVNAGVMMVGALFSAFTGRQKAFKKR